MYIFFPSFWTTIELKASGGSRSNRVLALEIAKERKTFVVRLKGKPHNSDRQSESNLFVIPPKFSSLYGRIQFLLNKLLFSKRQLEKLILHEGRAPVICSRSTIPLGLSLTRKYKLPLIIVMRAFEDLEQCGKINAYDKVSLFRKVDGLLNRNTILNAYKDADLIITNSEYMRSLIKREFCPRGEVKVIYPEISVSKGLRIEAIKRIGFVNKGMRKGITTVLSISRLLPDLSFHVFGEKLIDKDIPPNIIFEGYKTDQNSMFESIDLMLVPSLWAEPYGRVAAEAIMFGKPALVSNRGGLPEAVGNDYFVVDTDEAQDWLAIIQNLRALSLESLCEKVIAAQGVLLNQANVNRLTYEEIIKIESITEG